MIRTYRELSQLKTFEERFRYLQVRASVGAETFGYERYINQAFYRSQEWRRIRTQVIARDLGCDLGLEGFEIFDRVVIHHMNPMKIEDVVEGNEAILDPEFLITTTHKTHNAIHYGDDSFLEAKVLVERFPGDTRIW